MASGSDLNCKRADKYRPESENISPNTKSELKQKPGQKNPEN